MLAEAALILLLDYQRKTPGRNSISCPAFRATVGISTKGSKIHLMKNHPKLILQKSVLQISVYLAPSPIFNATVLSRNQN